MTIQLLRYTFQEDKAKKIQSNFSFPLALKAVRNDLGGFDFEKISDGSELDDEQQQTESNTSTNEATSGESVRYNLTSVMVHRGSSASSGHYICYSFNRA